MEATMQIGSIVRLIDDPEAGQTQIAAFTSTGYIRLKSDLNGSRFWLPQLLTEVKPALVDQQGREWWIIEREDGSIYISYILANDPIRLPHIVWDSWTVENELPQL